ncbi:hypothetical protein K440DRAFT_309407 [Wilcoxina mikolae CBS 423.85]|nr:hypothetical protein K440DRAFT_309407 [Wilcoxina mikolae CBS 423.85]
MRTSRTKLGESFIISDGLFFSVLTPFMVSTFKFICYVGGATTHDPCIANTTDFSALWQPRYFVFPLIIHDVFPKIFTLNFCWQERWFASRTALRKVFVEIKVS